MTGRARITGPSPPTSLTPNEPVVARSDAGVGWDKDCPGERVGRLGSAGMASHACAPDETQDASEQGGSCEAGAARERTAKLTKAGCGGGARRKPKPEDDENCRVGEAKKPRPVIEMADAGNCLFHAIRYHASQTQRDVRDKLAAEALQVWGDFFLFLGFDSGADFLEFLNTARADGEWCDARHIAVANSIYVPTLFVHAGADSASENGSGQVAPPLRPAPRALLPRSAGGEVQAGASKRYERGATPDTAASSGTPSSGLGGSNTGKRGRHRT